ncbi:MAG TPA: hypothetical protein VH542_00390 [Steroidobacteraceae bacterium]
MFRLLCLTVAALLLAGPVHCQDSLTARLQTRADSLLQSWREAQRLADVADSLERVRATAGFDTIAVGALRIIVNPSPLPVREAARRAWPMIDGLYGSASADLTEQPYIIRAVDPDSTVRRPVLHVGLEMPWDLSVRATAAVLVNTVPPPRFDPALATWLGTALRPLARPQDEQRAVFLQLVTAPSEAVRACFLGEITRCKDVLQLSDSSESLERWYVTPNEREALVIGFFSDYFARGATAPTLQQCRQHRDVACIALLKSLPSGSLPPPLAPVARLSLVREALRAGGRDAYTRLVANPSLPIGARVERAAGIGLDSVVTRWRSVLLAARPPRLTVPWWAGIAALGWTALFGLCAVRSSRWRL